MKKHFDSYKLSFIDSFAINDYFLSGLELYKRKVEFDANRNLYIRMVRDVRREYMAEMVKEKGYGETSEKVKSDLLASLVNYPNESLRQFKDLIIENSMQPSSFITANKKLYIATFAQSKLLLTINIISALFFSVIIFKKKFLTEEIYEKNIVFSLLIFFCIYFTYISTGLTFWQGDRFIIPIYYASIMLFVHQTRMFFAFIRNINKK
ncbi:hypothetical protein VU05_00200 [Desulfobulbus sp. F1]|nr:hypothetical protein [Desulfobulbus sp. F1]